VSFRFYVDVCVRACSCLCKLSLVVMDSEE
jgi:hypothetical protein